MNLTPGSQHVVSWAVTEGVTMELVMARVSHFTSLYLLAQLIVILMVMVMMMDRVP